MANIAAQDSRLATAVKGSDTSNLKFQLQNMSAAGTLIQTQAQLSLEEKGYSSEKAAITAGVLATLASGGAGVKRAKTSPIPVPENLPINIHMGQQGKHIKGHNNFEEGRSYIYSNVDPKKLLAGVHSNRYSVVTVGARGNPIVEFGRPIGVDGRTGKAVTKGQIHYGKNGAHIVPDSRN